MHDQMSKMGIPFSFLLISLLSIISSLCNAQTGMMNTTFQVGVILDLDSLVGRIGLTSLSLAISDFYSVNINYTTKLVLNVRDSKGLVTEAAATALSLLNDVEVDAIIGPQRSAQANFVIGLGDTAKVPIISFSATSPSLHPRTPYFVQTAPSDADQVGAIAAIVGNFHWNQVVLIYEDSDYGNGIIPYLSNAFQAVNVRVAYRSIIPLSATDDFLLQELYKMKTMQTRVFVVHVSISLASKLFLKAKETGMMSEGYAWILTSGLMDLFYSLDSHVVEAMQGVLGVKPLIPKSVKFNSMAQRWKTKFLQDNPDMLQAEFNLYGLWAYDTLWALAVAAERVGFRDPPSQNTSSFNSTNLFSTKVSQTGPKLLEEMLEITFEGPFGEFHLINGQQKPKSFQILNIVGKEEIEVGVWKSFDEKSTSESNVNLTMLTKDKFKSIRWPGESAVVPKGWEIPVSGNKLRIAVPAEAGFPEFVKVEKDPHSNAYKVTGFCTDMFDSVMKQLPYAVRHDYIPFQTDEGSSKRSYTNLSYYDNLAYAVFLGEFDAAVGDISITANRSEYVDFTLPFEAGGITMIAPIANYDPNEKWIFLMPFTKELWLTAIVLLILIGMTLWILEHRVNIAFRGPPSEHAGMLFYFPFMSIVYAQRERVVSNLSRLLVVVWMLVVLVLNSTYTASLSAKITVQKLKSTVNNVDQLLTNGDTVGCREGSFIVHYLKRFGFEESKINQYKSHDEIHQSLKNGSISAFFSVAPYTELFLSMHCDEYMTVGPNFETEGFGFVFPKGSPFVADVSRAVIKLTENGSKSAIEKTWLKKKECRRQYVTYKYADKTKISLKSFGILFGITGGIILICLLVFVFTYLYENRDFIIRIWNSNTTVWSKLGAICRHFDEKDPKSFRSNDPKDQAGEKMCDVNLLFL